MIWYRGTWSQRARTRSRWPAITKLLNRRILDTRMSKPMGTRTQTSSNLRLSTKILSTKKKITISICWTSTRASNPSSRSASTASTRIASQAQTMIFLISVIWIWTSRTGRWRRKRSGAHQIPARQNRCRQEPTSWTCTSSSHTTRPSKTISTCNLSKNKFLPWTKTGTNISTRCPTSSISSNSSSNGITYRAICKTGTHRDSSLPCIRITC